MDLEGLEGLYLEGARWEVGGVGVGVGVFCGRGRNGRDGRVNNDGMGVSCFEVGVVVVYGGIVIEVECWSVGEEIRYGSGRWVVWDVVRDGFQA